MIGCSNNLLNDNNLELCMRLSHSLSLFYSAII